MAHPNDPDPERSDQDGAKDSGNEVQVDADAELNTNLHEVLDLMSQQVERLKASLEFFRLSDHQNKDEIIRWHVREIDERQDRMDELKALILAGDDGSLH